MSDALERFLAPDTTTDEALGLFAHLRTTPDEGRVIEAILARSAYVSIPEPLLLAVASALVDRGEHETAMRVLTRLTSTPALVLRADLLAQRGDVAAGVAVLERALLRDIDWPGARERHARWSETLGPTGQTRSYDAGATLVKSETDAPFRLLREVGRGGAGVVYEAEDRELGRPAALKVYHRPDRDRAQLLHEARVATTLAGSGIVRVFDVDPGHGWLAMEWVGLGALRAALRARPPAMPPPIALWAIPFAVTLARVHAAGWVHHDVKPANILLRSFDRPLLTDFGTARRTGEPSPPGSLGYVSPERLAGRASDPRDDVYGFGRVLEDALDVVAQDSEVRLWRVVSAVCTGRDDGRPDSGRELVSLIGRSTA